MDAKPKITVKLTLTNSQGVSAEHTVEEEYPDDLSAGEVKEVVKGFGRGFHNMMEAFRMNKNGTATPASGTGTRNALGGPLTGAGRSSR